MYFGKVLMIRGGLSDRFCIDKSNDVINLATNRPVRSYSEHLDRKGKMLSSCASILGQPQPNAALAYHLRRGVT